MTKAELIASCTWFGSEEEQWLTDESHVSLEEVAQLVGRCAFHIPANRHRTRFVKAYCELRARNVPEASVFPPGGHEGSRWTAICNFAFAANYDAIGAELAELVSLVAEGCDPDETLECSGLMSVSLLRAAFAAGVDLRLVREAVAAGLAAEEVIAASA